MSFQILKEEQMVLVVLVNNLWNMNILQVFFWFCKEQKLMDIMFKMYRERKPRVWVNDYVNGAYFKRVSLKEFLELKIEHYGLTDLFWNLQSRNALIFENPRYKKARSKWNAFSRNNVMFSDDYIKIGDRVEGTERYNTNYSGVVTSIPKIFYGNVNIMTDDGKEMTVSIFRSYNIKINGEEKKLSFYIKRNRKVYGISKK